MKINRKQKIQDYQEKGRVIMLYGPRRVGKTTLAKKYLEEMQKLGLKTKYDIGDDLTLKRIFERQDRYELLNYAKSYDVIVVDEAQQIPNIGWVAKILIDEFPEKKIILTGSSSFDLAQQTGEPLVGRKFEMMLLPISIKELEESNFEVNRKIENFMVFGMYPEILSQDDNFKKEEKLKELINSYLFKDILALDKIKFPDLLLKIVQALAYQIGQEVSLKKLTKDVDETDHKKIGRYVDLLQKTYVIKKVGAYSNNLRNEIRANSKYYFYDLGLRNAVISNFKTLENREKTEVGLMWENFIFMELYKKSILQRQVYDNFFFWRYGKRMEVDFLIEGLNGKLEAYECKWGKEIPSFKIFLENYPQAKTQVINRENYLELF